MRTIRKLSFLGVLAVTIAVLFLVGISFMQAQVTARGKPEKPPGKPDKPGEEEVNWAVQIPEDTMLLGMQNKDGSPYVYANNNDDIIVSVEKKGWKTVGEGGTSGIYNILLFKLVNPTNSWVKFNGVNLSLLYSNPDERRCAFPGSCGSTPPSCMQYFLNQKHPYSSDPVEYDHDQKRHADRHQEIHHYLYVRCNHFNLQALLWSPA